MSNNRVHSYRSSLYIGLDIKLP